MARKPRGVGAGDRFVIPAGQPHGFTNTGKSPLKLWFGLFYGIYGVQWIEIDWDAGPRRVLIEYVESDIDLPRPAGQEPVKRDRKIMFKPTYQFLRVLLNILVLAHSVKARPPDDCCCWFELTVRDDVPNQLLAFSRIEDGAGEASGNSVFQPCPARKLVVFTAIRQRLSGRTPRPFAEGPTGDISD